MSKFFLALVTYGLLLQIGLVSAAPRIRVLTVGADKCTPRKQAALKTAIAEAIQMADAAITALSNPQVVGSKAFTDFLGEGNDRNAISAKNFQSVKSILSTELFTLTGITGAAERDIVFICPPDKEELAKVPLENDLAPTSKERCGGTFFAIARNGPPNIVKLCPIFFDKRQRKNGKTGVVEDIIAQPLDNAKKLYLAGDRIGGVPAIAILHELQHLQLVVGPEIAVDLPSKIDPVAGPPPPPDPSLKLPKVENPAYSVDQCKGLLPQFKIQNAQNFAWFAMDVFSDKSRGLPCGAPPSPSTPVASGSGSGSGSNSPRPGSPKPASPKTPTKPIARRAPPKVAAPKAAKPKAPTAAAPKKVVPGAAAKPKPAVAKPEPVAVKPKPIAAKPVAAKPAPVAVKPAPAAAKKPAPVAAKPKPVTAKPVPIAAKPAPVAAKPAPVATKPAPAAAKPKPNPLGGGTAPSGPRLARPARLSSSAPRPSPTKTTTGTGAKNGAKVGTGAKTTSTGVKKPTPTPTGKVSPAPATCKVIRRGVIHPISADGTFVP